jgi:flavin-binding protein dodecin
LRGSSWSLESLTLCLVTRLQHLLNELQHAAVGDLLSEEIGHYQVTLKIGFTLEG